MASKKAEAPQGCLGTECSNQSCVACQVAQAAQFHAEAMEVGARIAGAVEGLGKEVSILRNAIVEVSEYRAQKTPGTPERAKDRAAPTAAVKAEAQPTPANAGGSAVEAPAASAAPTTPAAKVTIDTIRPKVLEWIKKNGRDKFLAILGKFSAQKLPDVKDADLSKLMDELAAAGSF